MDMITAPTATVATHAEGDAMGFIDLTQIKALLLRNRYIILGSLATGLGLAVLATILMARLYTAEGSLQIEQPDNEILDDASVQQPWAASSFLLFQETQIDILESRAIAEQVVNATRLENDAEALDMLKIDSEDLPDDPVLRRVQLAQNLQERFEVEIEGETQIINVYFSSPDANLSARMANAFLDSFSQMNLSRRFESSAYARRFLEDQIAEARKQLEESERDALAYARQAKLLDTSNSTASQRSDLDSSTISITTTDLVQLNTALNDAREARIVAEARWRAAAGSSPLSLPQAQENVAIQRLQEERAKAQAELVEQRERYTRSYPTVGRLEEHIDELDRQIMGIANDARASVRQAYEAAANTEEQLARRVASLKGETLTEQDRSVEYNILRRQADTNHQVYDALLQRLEEVNQTAQLSTNNVIILDRPFPPGDPSSPKPLLNLMGGLILASLMASVIIFVREVSGNMVSDPKQLQSWFRMPVLGVIPEANKDSTPFEQVRMPLTPIAEAYQSMAATLRLNLLIGGKAPVALVTSSNASEGKSLSAYALAQNLAGSGHRVVLVDGDLRRGRLHRLIGKKAAAGLTEVLTGQELLCDVLQSADERFDLLFRGATPPDPALLLSSPQMGQAIEKLRDQYDVVILDTPPLLGLADTVELSAHSDFVVLVVEADSTVRQRIEESLRRLHMAKANVLGAVLTKFDPAAAGNNNTYGYNYYRYSNDDED